MNDSERTLDRMRPCCASRPGHQHRSYCERFTEPVGVAKSDSSSIECCDKCGDEMDGAMHAHWGLYACHAIAALRAEAVKRTSELHTWKETATTLRAELDRLIEAFRDPCVVVTHTLAGAPIIGQRHADDCAGCAWREKYGFAPVEDDDGR